MSGVSHGGGVVSGVSHDGEVVGGGVSGVRAVTKLVLGTV